MTGARHQAAPARLYTRHVDSSAHRQATSQRQAQRLAGGFTSCPVNKSVSFSKVPSTGVVAKCHNILSATHQILMVVLGFLLLRSALMLLWLPLLTEFRQGVTLWRSWTPSSLRVSISNCLSHNSLPVLAVTSRTDSVHSSFLRSLPWAWIILLEKTDR